MISPLNEFETDDALEDLATENPGYQGFWMPFITDGTVFSNPAFGHNGSLLNVDTLTKMLDHPHALLPFTKKPYRRLKAGKSDEHSLTGFQNLVTAAVCMVDMCGGIEQPRDHDFCVSIRGNVFPSLDQLCTYTATTVCGCDDYIIENPHLFADRLPQVISTSNDRVSGLRWSVTSKTDTYEVAAFVSAHHKASVTALCVTFNHKASATALSVCPAWWATHVAGVPELTNHEGSRTVSFIIRRQYPIRDRDGIGGVVSTQHEPARSTVKASTPLMSTAPASSVPALTS